MKKPKEYPPAPYWKEHIPKCPEHTEWKRDEHGFPIFHDDGTCVVCKKKDVKPSTPWYAFKYQILGYCEDCVKAKMAPEPTPEEHAKYAAACAPKTVSRISIQPEFLCPETDLILELEAIASSKLPT